MSYDLIFKPKNDDFTLDKFEAYLKRKAVYSLNKKANELNAVYENKSTGVNFNFDYKLDSESGIRSVLFSLNYLKPSYFAKEADVELKSLVEIFDLIVEDPQMNGIAVEVYNSVEFINAWTHANKQACQIAEQNGHQLLSLPSEKIESVWQWNNNKDAVQSSIAFDVFVPSIMYVAINGKLLTACVWGDGIPIAIPPVDIVIVVRKDILSKKDPKEKEGMAVAKISEVNQVLAEYRRNIDDDSYYIFYKKIPFSIRKFLLNLDGIVASDLTRVPFEAIIDASLLL